MVSDLRIERYADIRWWIYKQQTSRRDGDPRFLGKHHGMKRLTFFFHLIMEGLVS